ncbi:MAG TPA: biotin/lipoyl-containing protein [Bdellovibrionota bacterium]|nr:biotin/lipoyl-containing protein [Bdellovibrionota bacterium]
MILHFTSKDIQGNARIENIPGTITVERDDRTTLFRYVPTATGFRLEHQGKVLETTVAFRRDTEIDISVNGHLVPLHCSDPRRSPGDVESRVEQGSRQIRAIMPGRVVRVFVRPGDAVVSGDSLLVLEAMKMENEVKATINGTVESVAVSSGASVERGELLISLVPNGHA